MPTKPMLFILFIADIEKFMRKRQERGTTIGNKRIFILAYARSGNVGRNEERNGKDVDKFEKIFG